MSQGTLDSINTVCWECNVCWPRVCNTCLTIPPEPVLTAADDAADAATANEQREAKKMHRASIEKHRAPLPREHKLPRYFPTERTFGTLRPRARAKKKWLWVSTATRCARVIHQSEPPTVLVLTNPT